MSTRVLAYVDLLLLPTTHRTKLVLIEAKRVADSRSAADVLGQLLKYYAHSLAIGSQGLKKFVEAAKEYADPNRPSRLLSLKRVFGAASLDEAQLKASAGTPLEPDDITLVVALDGPAPKLEQRLLQTCAALEKHHRLSIGISATEGDKPPRWLRSPVDVKPATCAG